MSQETTWRMAVAASYLLPMGVALALLIAPRPRRTVVRAAAAIAAGWVVDVVYTAELYNPIARRYWLAHGMEDAAVRFDNNTVAIALVVGWFYPLAAVLAYLAYRSARRRLTSG